MKNEYRDMSIQSEIDHASPYRLIQMLLSACVDRIRESICHDEANEISKKCEKITKAVNIIQYLRSILDVGQEENSKFVAELTRVYDYTEQQLLQANITNNRNCLKLALNTTQKVKSSWDEMGVKNGLR